MVESASINSNPLRYGITHHPRKSSWSTKSTKFGLFVIFVDQSLFLGLLHRQNDLPHHSTLFNHAMRLLRFGERQRERDQHAEIAVLNKL